MRPLLHFSSPHGLGTFFLAAVCTCDLVHVPVALGHWQDDLTLSSRLCLKKSPEIARKVLNGRIFRLFQRTHAGDNCKDRVLVLASGHEPEAGREGTVQIDRMVL